MLKRFKKTTTDLTSVKGLLDLSKLTGQTLTTIQNRIQEVVDPVLTKDILSGHLLTDIEITHGTPLNVQHLLGRTIKGCIVTKKSSDSIIYETDNDNPNKFITLNAVSLGAVATTAEYVSARYHQVNAQTIAPTTPTIINYEALDFDSHGAVTIGATWKFTAPIDGIYNVSAGGRLASRAWSAGQGTALFLFKNNSLICYLGNERTDINATYGLNGMWGSTLINLMAGDYIDIRLQHSAASNTDTLPTNQALHVSINNVNANLTSTPSSGIGTTVVDIWVF